MSNNERIVLNVEVKGSAKAAAELTGVAAAVEAVDDNSQKLAGSGNKLNQNFVAMNRNTKALGGSMSSLGARMSSFNRSFPGVTNKIKHFNNQLFASRKQLKFLLNNFSDADDRMALWQKHLLESSRKMSVFTKLARGMLFAFIALGAEFVVVALGLASINAAFAIGNAAVKVYKVSLAALAYGIAAVGQALATAAAAQREYTAAQNAYAYKATPVFGSAMNHSTAALRNLTSDAQLAMFGIMELNAAFSAVSKNSAFTGQSQNVLRALSDFAAMGGDSQKSLAAIGNFIGVLQKEGRATYKVTEAARAVGPEFEKAFKQIKKSGGGVQEIFAAITGGEMSKAAGITGQAAAVNSTLFGLMKTYKTLMISLFADIGGPMLEPTKQAFKEIYENIRRGIVRLTPILAQFSKGGFLKSLVKLSDVLSNFTVNFLGKYLPKAEGLGRKFIDGFYEIRRTFYVLVDYLDKLRAGGTVLIQTWGKPLREFFDSIGQNIEHLSYLSRDNEGVLLQFGDRLKGIVDALFDFAQTFKEAFVSALPIINIVLRAVELAVRAIDKAASLLSSSTLGAALMMGFVGKGVMGGTRGAQIRAHHAKKSGGMGGGLGGLVSMGMMASSLFGLPGSAGGGQRAFNASGPMSQTMPAGFIGPPSPMMANQLVSQQAANRVAQGRFTSRLGLRGQRMMTGLSGFMNPIGANISGMHNANALAGGNLSKFKKGMAFMQGGMSMKSLGLSMAASYLLGQDFMPQAVKQNQGALQLGAGLASFNPLIGLGVAGAGTLLNLAKGTGADTKAGGIGTGMAAGAATGAAIGSFIPGVGTAVGAAVGTIIGGITGYFGGDKAERRVAKEAAKSYAFKHIGSAVGDMIYGRSINARGVMDKFVDEANKFGKMDNAARKAFIEKQRKAGILTDVQAERAATHTGTFAKEITTLAKDYSAVINATTGDFEELMTQLQGASGKSRDEIMSLAQAMNVDLYDPTLKATEAIKGLGLQMDMTAAGIARAGNDALLNVSAFTDYFKTKELTDAANMAQQKIRAGGASKEDFMDYFQKTLAFATANDPNNPLGTLFAIQDAFSKEGGLFGPGGAAGNNYGRFVSTGGKAMTDKYTTEAASNLATVQARQIGQLLTDSNLGFTNGITGFNTLQGALQRAFLSNNPETRAAALEIESRMSSGIGLGNNKDEILALLNRLDPSGNLFNASALATTTRGTLSEQLTDQQKELQTDIRNAIKAGFDTKPMWWESVPEWWSKEAIEAILPPDTSTPRAGRVGDTLTSRLGRTLSRHNYMDSMFTGKRTVTSSFRTNHLGSINSDHVTGNAYDLVGQNLGQYATSINKMGGFAEFHGVAGSRHLHVVPGPTPIGDSSSPAVGVGGTTQVFPPATFGAQVTVNVYPREGQSEQEIARFVMSEISKAQRNAKERR